jgi:deoxyribonuclease-4
MADRPRFGPAGMPPGFKALKQPVTQVPKYLHDEGLDSFEYQMARWGPVPQIRQEVAEQLRKNAIDNDVWLTAHGSYFINLTAAKEEVLEASKKRLLACVTGANWMGAHIVVIHPGSYAGRPSQEVYVTCEKALKEVVENMYSLGLTRIHLAPETMGKGSQFGSLEEVLTLCERIELTEPNVDWAHLHARDGGSFKTIDDVRKAMDEIEKRLGSAALKNLHCHFSHIEFTEKGERRHHNLERVEYGPNFNFLATLIAERSLNPVIACETPNLDADALKLREIVLKQIRTWRNLS